MPARARAGRSAAARADTGAARPGSLLRAGASVVAGLAADRHSGELREGRRQQDCSAAPGGDNRWPNWPSPAGARPVVRRWWRRQSDGQRRRPARVLWDRSDRNEFIQCERGGNVCRPACCAGLRPIRFNPVLGGRWLPGRGLQPRLQPLRHLQRLRGLNTICSEIVSTRWWTVSRRVVKVEHPSERFFATRWDVGIAKEIL